jgi:hypothetical protein
LPFLPLFHVVATLSLVSVPTLMSCSSKSRIFVIPLQGPFQAQQSSCQDHSTFCHSCIWTMPLHLLINNNQLCPTCIVVMVCFPCIFCKIITNLYLLSKIALMLKQFCHSSSCYQHDMSLETMSLNFLTNQTNIPSHIPLQNTAKSWLLTVQCQRISCLHHLKDIRSRCHRINQHGIGAFWKIHCHVEENIQLFNWDLLSYLLFRWHGCFNLIMILIC